MMEWQKSILDFKRQSDRIVEWREIILNFEGLDGYFGILGVFK